MNYIRHLTAFYEMVSSDDRLFPSHISLYMALFQLWNLNHFKNPVSICRKDTLQLSKIGSYNTYHKCLHDLHSFGYIKYEPSHNQFIGSKVHLYSFDTSTDTTSVQPLRQPQRKIDTTSVQALRHSLNYINILNNKTESEEKAQTQNPKIENFSPEKNNKSDLSKNEKEKRKKVAPKKEKNFVPPSLDEALSFFLANQYPELEAKKFFFHFESNGWKVGGKSPMKNWQAAAHNWMLNVSKFEPMQKQTEEKTNQTKRYDEPL